MPPEFLRFFILVHIDCIASAPEGPSPRNIRHKERKGRKKGRQERRKESQGKREGKRKERGMEGSSRKEVAEPPGRP